MGRTTDLTRKGKTVKTWFLVLFLVVFGALGAGATPLGVESDGPQALRVGSCDLISEDRGVCTFDAEGRQVGMLFHPHVVSEMMNRMAKLEKDMGEVRKSHDGLAKRLTQNMEKKIGELRDTVQAIDQKAVDALAASKEVNEAHGKTAAAMETFQDEFKTQVNKIGDTTNMLGKALSSATWKVAVGFGVVILLGGGMIWLVRKDLSNQIASFHEDFKRAVADANPKPPSGDVEVPEPSIEDAAAVASIRERHRVESIAPAQVFSASEGMPQLPSGISQDEAEREEERRMEHLNEVLQPGRASQSHLTQAAS